MAVTNTVSLRIELARQATRSSRAARLFCQRSPKRTSGFGAEPECRPGARGVRLRRER